MIQVEQVSDQEAFCMCHRLARTEGLMVLQIFVYLTQIIFCVITFTKTMSMSN